MAMAGTHPRSLAGRLIGGPIAQGVMLRVVWMTGVFLALAITAGPLFAPAFASYQESDGQLLIWSEAGQRSIESDAAFSAVRCRSAADGRQVELLALASARLGSEPVEHVAARFWNEQTGTAEVTFEFWHGSDAANRKLYEGRGLVDLESCTVTLVSLT